jgi:hypothetical protein
MPTTEAHSCSAVDQSFIQVAGVQMTAFRTWGGEYVSGQTDPAVLAALAQEAHMLIVRKRPQDASLVRAHSLMVAMLTEYNRAMTGLASGTGGARELQRVHVLGGHLRGVLSQAAPALGAHGCRLDTLF